MHSYTIFSLLIKCLTETLPNHNMEETKLAKLENELHQHKGKLEAMMRILQNLSTSGWSNTISNFDNILHYIFVNVHLQRKPSSSFFTWLMKKLIYFCAFSFKENFPAAFFLGWRKIWYIFVYSALKKNFQHFLSFCFFLPALLPWSNFALEETLTKEETLKDFDGHSFQIISNPNFCSNPNIEVSEGFPWNWG